MLRRPAGFKCAVQRSLNTPAGSPLPASTGERMEGVPLCPCPSGFPLSPRTDLPLQGTASAEAPPTYRRKAVPFLPLQYWLAEITSPAPVRSGGVWGCYFGFTEDIAWQEANTFHAVEQPPFCRRPPICRRLAFSLLWRQEGEGARPALPACHAEALRKSRKMARGRAQAVSGCFA